MSLRVAGGIIGAAAGFFIGGPVGAQIGWAAGSMLGGAFQKSDEVENVGPRLEDLNRPTSNIIGKQISIVYGTDRLPGNIIWASDIKETKHVSEESQGGKGGGSKQTVVSTTFTYSINMAVAFAEGPVSGFRRIWVNKALIYSVDDDTISAPDLEMIFYYGEEDQAPDTTMQSYEGVNIPAYRGLAYIMFKDFQLVDYGNRVPMTIEAETVGAGTPTIRATETFQSEAIFAENYPRWGSSTPIVRSPATGILWVPAPEMNGPEDIENGFIAIGLDDNGNYITSVKPNPTQNLGDGRDPNSMRGFIDVIVDADGYLIFVCVGESKFYEASQWKYNRYLVYYHETGDYLGVSPRSGFQSGSFNFWDIIHPSLIKNKASFWITGSYDYVYVTTVDTGSRKNLDGTHDTYVSSGVDSFNTIHTIDNSNYNQTYTKDILSPSGKCGWLIHENDETGTQKDFYSLKWSATEGAIAMCLAESVTLGADNIIDNIHFTTHKLLGSYDYAGDNSDPLGMNGVVLADGGIFIFVNINSIANDICDAWYKASGDTDFTTYCGRKDFGFTVSDLETVTCTYDANRREIIHLRNNPYTMYSFNVDTYEWITEGTVNNWTASEITPHDQPAYRPLYMNNSNFYLLGVDSATGNRLEVLRINRNHIDKNTTTLGIITNDVADRCTVDTTNHVDTNAIDSIEVKGFSIRTHTTGKNILNTIFPAFFVYPVESEWLLKFSPIIDETAIVINNNDLNAQIGDPNANKSELYEINNEDEVDDIPKALALHYAGYNNNYLKTQQSYYRNGYLYNHDNAETVDIPVVMDDTYASQLVEKMLYLLFITATKFKIYLPIKYAYLEVADVLSFAVNKGNEVFTGTITNINTDALNVWR